LPKVQNEILIWRLFWQNHQPMEKNLEKCLLISSSYRILSSSYSKSTQYYILKNLHYRWRYWKLSLPQRKLWSFSVTRNFKVRYIFRISIRLRNIFCLTICVFKNYFYVSSPLLHFNWAESKCRHYFTQNIHPWDYFWGIYSILFWHHNGCALTYGGSCSVFSHRFCSAKGPPGCSGRESNPGPTKW